MEVLLPIIDTIFRANPVDLVPVLKLHGVTEPVLF